MSRPFSVVIHARESDHHTIRKNGFISCIVSFNAPRARTVRMGFCLHCKELLTYMGASKHCKQLVRKHQAQLSKLFCHEQTDLYERQILSDVELLWEKWSSKEYAVSQVSSPFSIEGDCFNESSSKDICPSSEMSRVENGSCPDGICD